jgi:hypothetical protein
MVGEAFTGVGWRQHSRGVDTGLAVGLGKVYRPKLENATMPIDKSPPWRAVSWETKYPEDKDDPPREDGLAYWMIESAAGYTVASDWMTEEQARMIAAAPEVTAALKQSLAGHYATWMAARAEVEGASVSAALFEKEPEVIAARAALAKAEGK